VSENTLLSAKDVWKSCDSRWILQEIDLTVKRNEMVHLRGTNGAGKTTLLRILAGELQPSRGEVMIDGTALGSGPHEGRHRLAFIPEILLPSPFLTVEEYLLFRASLRGMNPSTARERVETTIDDWECSAFSTRPMETLSHGERRRVVLAGALLSQPDILLLDEPTVGLDTRQCKRFVERLESLVEGRAVLVATHVESQGLPSCHRVISLRDGRVVNFASGDEPIVAAPNEDDRVVSTTGENDRVVAAPDEEGSK